MTSPAGLEIATDSVVELLQTLIRNECVNDGTIESGNELRNADTLTSVIEGRGVEIESFDAAPGRRSVVGRIAGTDPTAPSVCLMGHTDVVPVSPDGWREDPFGGELIDGEVWGRGAVDMLNLTASMAVVFRAIADAEVRPKGDLIYFGVADEEAGGTHGAKYVIDNHWDAVACDYVLTENGGLLSHSSVGSYLTMNVAEKGAAWHRLVVTGTPGHGSMPYGTDNAVVKAAEVVRRFAEYRPKTQLSDLWHARIATLDFPEEISDALTDPERAYDAIASLPGRGAQKHFYSCTHTTFSPNVGHGGTKTNVIPDRVEIDVDIRTLPGETPETVRAHLEEVLGDLAGEVELIPLTHAPATESPIDTPLWHAMADAAWRHYPDAQLLPAMIVGLTDARFFREKGVVAYGAGLLSENISGADFSSRFHGHNERIDVESLALTTDFWKHTLASLWR